ncbi:MAG: 3-hydroxybutyryl-CoA dehydrogenase [Planctomycetota bacterium]|jgi:3-hydroxybutyryl-CoA dehydrogenase
MTNSIEATPVLVIGAGVMGSGIAQVAAQAGHPVMLYDLHAQAATDAKSGLVEIFDRLVAKGKLSAAEATRIWARIIPLETLEDASKAGLVIEAVIEDIEIKRGMFQHLESIVSEDCLLATNTSSISITAIAKGLSNPGRLVGMHFFNPVALMKLVEVVSGLQTEPAIAERIIALAKRWGKVPVRANSTPGFIVNRIARPFYAEALALLQEQAATPEQIDTCMRGAGFRMGPCELMDLIGHDTNLAVTTSVFEANFYDQRYLPSQLQTEMVAGGLLGRKSGRGFYDYNNKVDAKPGEFSKPDVLPSRESLSVHGHGPLSDLIGAQLRKYDCPFEAVLDSDWTGLQVGNAQLRLCDGRPASEFGQDVSVFDLPLVTTEGTALAWSPATTASPQWVDACEAWLAVLGFRALRIADVPGLIIARSIAMLINEASDAVHQGVCDEASADVAMQLGVNYPAGPFEWLDSWKADAIIQLLDRLDRYYRGERYRVSPLLRHKHWQNE